MEIVYKNDLADLAAGQLAGFFAGWPEHPNPEAHLQILRGSYAVWLAFDGDRCVGFINALSDGAFYAYIPLLEVLPKYQKHGIGAELVRRMLESLKAMYAVDVVCDDEIAGFYKSLGFHRCAGMVWRNFENQGARKAQA